MGRTEGMIGIGEMARRAGVSVRTLRHYDAIGLLQPAQVTQAGYRLYNGAAMARLEQILFFKALGFPLEEIKTIVTHPAFDAKEAMKRQRKLLLMERSRIDGMLARLDEALEGQKTPQLEVFDMSEIEKVRAQYAEEVKARWGNTDAYRQSARREEKSTKEDWTRIQAGLDALMQEFAAARDLDADDVCVQALVGRWQQYITEHFYACTNEILAGLGQLYAADQRFRANIDRHGEGTAELMSRAVAVYCAKSPCAY